MNNEIIKITNLKVQVGNKYLLRDINWSIKKHENWLLFGLNGCGKTTLLSIIAGYANYTSGQVKVLGETYNEETTTRLRRRIGYISSSFFTKQYKYETVIQVILSGLTGCLGLDFNISNKDIIRAKQLLKNIGMLDKANQTFQELSKGEQQKVLIVRSLITNPEILILDEPTTGLDLYIREQMLQFIKKILPQKITIIYVTHYLEEILEGLDKCLILKNGTVYACGNTKELITKTLLQELR